MIFRDVFEIRPQNYAYPVPSHKFYFTVIFKCSQYLVFSPTMLLVKHTIKRLWMCT